MLAYNTSVHTSTNFTPYEHLFGHKAFTPGSVYDLHRGQLYPEYIKFLHHRLKLSRDKALENIQRPKERSKEYYDNHSRFVQYKVSDFVYLKNHVRLLKSLPYVWKGPYKVVKINGRNTITPLINRRHVTHHCGEVKPASRSNINEHYITLLFSHSNLSTGQDSSNPKQFGNLFRPFRISKPSR